MIIFSLRLMCLLIKTAKIKKLVLLKKRYRLIESVLFMSRIYCITSCPVSLFLSLFFPFSISIVYLDKM